MSRYTSAYSYRRHLYPGGTYRPNHQTGSYRPQYDSSLWASNIDSPAVAQGVRFEIDRHLYDNRHAHHTDEYERYALIVRRGQSFRLTVTVPGDYSADTHRLQLEFNVGDKPQISRGTKVKVAVRDSMPPPTEWGSVIKHVKSLDGAVGAEVEMDVQAACDCAVGRYTMWVYVYAQSTQGESQQTNGPAARPRKYKAEADIYLIFNPWCKDDLVYVADEAEREEYVMKDTGRIWIGSEYEFFGKPWNFDQFERNVLEAALYLLDQSYLETHSHGNPVAVVRALTALLNSCDGDSGVLTGNWSGKYTGGTHPTAWNGSSAILREFMLRKRPVKFGQCWVFSGVTTTVCRTLGIPSRSVTNFESAHDKDGSLSIDTHFSSEGHPLKHLDDSIWNFHVWNETWMRRPDLPGKYGGWQAMDSTPQEASEGQMRCGPAPVSAIKQGEVYLSYDAKFIFAEVNGDEVTWFVHEGDARPVDVKKNSVGKFISTKAVGSNDRMDITENYKYPEGSTEERAAVEKACLFSSRKRALVDMYDMQDRRDVIVTVNGERCDNGDLEVIVTADNTSEAPRTVDISLLAVAMYYTGRTGEALKQRTQNIKVPANNKESVHWFLKAHEIMNSLDSDATIAVYMIAKATPGDQIYTIHRTFPIKLPTLHISVSKQTVKINDSVEVTVTFTNPLSVAMTTPVLNIEAGGIQKAMEIPIRKPIAPGSTITETYTINPKVKGQREVIANLHCRQLTNITGAADIQVIE